MVVFLAWVGALFLIAVFFALCACAYTNHRMAVEFSKIAVDDRVKTHAEFGDLRRLVVSVSESCAEFGGRLDEIERLVALERDQLSDSNE